MLEDLSNRRFIAPVILFKNRNGNCNGEEENKHKTIHVSLRIYQRHDVYHLTKTIIL